MELYKISTSSVFLATPCRNTTRLVFECSIDDVAAWSKIQLAKNSHFRGHVTVKRTFDDPGGSMTSSQVFLVQNRMPEWKSAPDQITLEGSESEKSRQRSLTSFDLS